MDITFRPTPRQMDAFNYLMDDKTTEVLFGGGNGGGKSYLGASWIIIMALKYPGTRYVIARSRLGILKQTTVKTFIDIVRSWKLEPYVDYHLFNNYITFKNGSEVILLDLFLFPADPDFVKLGSLEITAALIDEAAEIDERAYTILTTRFRYKLKEYKLIPKLLIVSNPTRGWLYNNFYRANKNNELPEHRKFIRSLPTDNPYLTKEYLEALKRLPELDRKRLYEGQWEFSKEEMDIFNIDKLYDMFFNKIKGGEKYISADIASTGNDKTVIIYWDGLIAKNIFMFSHMDTNQIVNKIKDLMLYYKVPVSHIVIDAIGVGTGVADLLKGCKRFIAGSSPLKHEPFINIKSQMYFKLSEYINNGLLVIEEQEHKETIIDELISHKRHKGDQDGKYQITPKDIVKRTIGHSPDISDALMMRMYFEIKKRHRTYVY